MQKAAAAMQNPQPMYDELGNLLLRTVQPITPVREGILRDGWYIVRESINPPVLRNDVSYALFVDLGTRYMQGRQMRQKTLDASFEESKQIVQRYADKVLAKVGQG